MLFGSYSPMFVDDHGLPPTGPINPKADEETEKFLAMLAQRDDVAHKLLEAVEAVLELIVKKER